VRYELTPSLVLYIRENVLRAVRTEAEEIVDDLSIFRGYEASKGRTISLTLTRKVEGMPCLHVYETSTERPEEQLTMETYLTRKTARNTECD
jgi:Cft2 family RNA processing exonuclease